MPPKEIKHQCNNFHNCFMCTELIVPWNLSVKIVLKKSINNFLIKKKEGDPFSLNFRLDLEN